MGKTIFLQNDLIHKINLKTKPVGALGRLEEIALQVGKIQNSLSPKINMPHIIVFAADHGIAKTGLVNPYPQSVTAQMVLNFNKGGAAINVFCRQNNIGLTVVDSGVNYEFQNISSSQKFINAKIGYGTKNYLEHDAMTEREALYAVEKGKEIVKTIASDGCNIIGFGEMGIGNTSSASLIMSSILQLNLEDCVGRGAGVNDDQLALKIDTLKKVFQLRKLHGLSANPIELLQKVGGYEIAMITGAYLEAKNQNMIIVVDGFIGTAALLIASKMDESVLANCIFAHTSSEHGHEKMLHHLNAKPLLQLQMRLGEGTGAALAIPLIQSAVNFLDEMASFESAGISNKK